MKTASLTQKYRPLLLAGLALIVLPFVLPRSASRSTPEPWW